MNKTKIRALELHINEYRDLLARLPEDDLAGRAAAHTRLNDLEADYFSYAGVPYNRDCSILTDQTLIRRVAMDTTCYTEEDYDQEHRYG